jgi:hypothetical protein
MATLNLTEQRQITSTLREIYQYFNAAQGFEETE